MESGKYGKHAALMIYSLFAADSFKTSKSLYVFYHHHLFSIISPSHIPHAHTSPSQILQKLINFTYKTKRFNFQMAHSFPPRHAVLCIFILKPYSHPPPQSSSLALLLLTRFLSDVFSFKPCCLNALFLVSLAISFKVSF